MYTYTKTFAGVALNQFDTRSVENELFLEFLENLGEYDLADVDLDILDDFKLDPKSEALCKEMLNWLIDNKEALVNAGYDFHHDYNGADKNPVILGKYIDIDLPDIGANKFNVKKNMDMMLKMEQEAVELFKTLPENIYFALPDFWGPGVWFNQHSS
jgi:hypothetical protein